MGILNITPDSFSDGGSYITIDKALKRTEQMIAEGASIIDVGGESTRPGYIALSAEEEIERTIPVIEAIKARFEIPVSLDTYKSKTAQAGIAAGVDMINDIWGLQYDTDMAAVIAKSGLPCCLMHNRVEAEYTDFLSDVQKDMQRIVQTAMDAGIAEDNILLDVGVGFGKTYEHNLQAIHHMEQFLQLGYPLLLGASRKSVIGITLGLPTEERLEGTIVTTVLAVLKGCTFVRVHDVKENVRAIRMAEAIRNSGRADTEGNEDNE